MSVRVVSRGADTEARDGSQPPDDSRVAVNRFEFLRPSRVGLVVPVPNLSLIPRSMNQIR
jgi:hypothetical protein